MSAEESSKLKEQKLLDTIFSLPEEDLNEIRGKPEKVLETIDRYTNELSLSMNVGPYKAKIVNEKIEEVSPKLMVELGCYLGYSAIQFASHLTAPGARYYSFEVNPVFAGLARKLIDLAGLSQKVEIIVGKASESLIAFSENLLDKKKGYVAFDFIFIDHWKDLYVPDFRLMESLNLIAPGTIIAADNIFKPGVPDYVNYVNGSPEERRNFNQNTPNIDGAAYVGRWNILYESETVISKNSRGDKDGVEITKCLEYLNG